MGVRAHIGSGTVYLTADDRGPWVNVDVPGERCFLARDRPDLVEKYAGTDADYFAAHKDVTVDSLREGPRDQERICDVYGSWQRLPFAIGECEEILSRQCFEHLSPTEARAAMDEVDRVLAPGGILRLDVPDWDETLRLYQETGDPLLKRHLTGPRRDAYSYHCVGYTREALRALVEEWGLIFETEE